MHLVAFLLELELHFLVFFGVGLALEVSAFDLAFSLADLVLEVLYLIIELEVLVVLLKLNIVSLTSNLVAFLDSILSPSLGLLKVSSKLFDDLSVLSIIALLVKSLILQDELLQLSPELVTCIVLIFLSFEAERVKLRLDNLELALDLKEVVLQPLILRSLRFKVYAMSAFDIFHDLHSKDVSVNWE